MEHIIIIGNGISGVTAARHIRKLSNKKITIVSSETDYFFSRTALMYVYMGHLTFEHTQPYENWFWEKNKIALKKGYVKKIETTSKTLHFEKGAPLGYDRLIIATGSKSNKFGWPGQESNGVQGLYSKQDLDVLEQNAPNNKVCKRAVIVGGGLIGIELAEMLSTRSIPVTFLVREKNFWDVVLPISESQMLNRHIKNHDIDLRLNTNLQEIKCDEDGNVSAIIIAETQEEIDCDIVGLTVGVSPNIDFIKSSEIETNRGILVNRFLETNIENVFAIGDCVEQREAIGNRATIESLWYTGRMMGETVAQSICDNRIEYNPGNWFNSAKFFDIEYQTYGWVFPQPRNNEQHFHWKHEDDTKCITVAFDTYTKAFLGINTFGIRMRHETIDRWLTEKRDTDYVMEHLGEANFDPEFYNTFENEMLLAYKNQFQKAQLR